MSSATQRPDDAEDRVHPPPGAVRSGETLDAICGGVVRVLQRERGYRFNLDPILLVHFAESSSRGLRGPAIDLGTGSGIIPLILARKFGRAELTALELQPSLFEIARRNVALNRIEGRVHVVQGDLREVREHFAPGAFHHVLCNPPYGRVHGGRLNPAAEKAIARHELCATMEDVCAAAAFLLVDGGSFWVISPAPRLSELLLTLARFRLTTRRIQLVHPFADRKARLALVQAVKGGRNQVTVCPPLLLHERDRTGFTPPVEEMLGATPGTRIPESH